MYSVTLLSSFLYCQRKIYLEKVLGLKEPIRKELVLGKVKHQAFEHASKIEKEIIISIKEKLSFEKLHQIYKEKYAGLVRSLILKSQAALRQFDIDSEQLFNKTINNLYVFAQERALLVSSLIENHNIFGNELWEKLTPKIRSELKIKSRKLELSGIIDQVEIYKKGLVPIELKTGKAPKEDAWPGHKIQLTAYALLLEDLYKTQIKEGFIYYIESNEKRHIALNPFMKQEIGEIKNKLKSLLISKKPPHITSNSKKCEICGLRDTCHNPSKINYILSLKNNN